MTYQGWTNQETWSVNLWIDNDCNLYQAKVRVLESLNRSNLPVTDKMVEQFVLYHMPDGTPDLSLKDYDKVNWSEIAEHWTMEAVELAEYDNDEDKKG